LPFATSWSLLVLPPCDCFRSCFWPSFLGWPSARHAVPRATARKDAATSLETVALDLTVSSRDSGLTARPVTIRRASKLTCRHAHPVCGANCISDCDRKSDCNPGYGSEWSKRDKCPLNVCCSKHGYCGVSLAGPGCFPRNHSLTSMPSCLARPPRTFAATKRLNTRHAPRTAETRVSLATSKDGPRTGRAMFSGLSRSPSGCIRISTLLSPRSTLSRSRSCRRRRQTSTSTSG
jgi:hypothetical protein